MRNSILYFFLLILEVFLDLTLDIIHKWDKILKTFSRKNLKFFQIIRFYFFLFNTKFVLLSIKAYFIIRK